MTQELKHSPDLYKEMLEALEGIVQSEEIGEIVVHAGSLDEMEKAKAVLAKVKGETYEQGLDL